MSHLFAPWRHGWVTQSSEDAAERPADACLFCGIWARPELDGENLVVHRDSRALVMLNRYPYNGGHLMVVPADHVATLQQLSPEARAAIVDLAAEACARADDLWSPDGFNMGVNQGRAGGAGIPDHLHFHLVPRWDGDTNFMTTVSATRVVSTDLVRVADELREAFAGAERKPPA